MLKTRIIVLIQILALIVAGTIGTAQAAMIGTADHFADAAREQQLARVDAVLASDAVQEQLIALGVNPEDAMARVAALSAEELQLLAQQIDELPAGGILGVLGVILVVLIVLEVLGVTNVFTKL
jgi:hypothetical protein